MRFLILSLVVVSALMAGCALVSGDSPVAARFGLESESSAEATPMLQATGMIEAEDVCIMAEVNGRVLNVLVDEGDDVGTGEVLLKLDTTHVDAQVEEARMGIRAAQANLDNALKPVRPQEIQIARINVEKAEAMRDGAARTLQNMIDMRDNPLELNSRINEARSQIETAAKQIELAQARLAEAEAGRDLYQFSASDEDKTQYQVYLKQVESAQAAIAGAETTYKGLQSQFDSLLKTRDNPLALNANVNAARSQLDVAERVTAVAEAELALLEAGPRAEDVAVDRAMIELAEAVSGGLEVQRGKMTLRSPVSGLVSTRSIEPGEIAVAGRPLLSVINLDEVTLRVYIPTDEIGKVKLGQNADILVDAFPGRPFPGLVSFISPQAEFTPKNIQTQKERVKMVFAVKIEADNADHFLKPGMPADATVYLDEPKPRVMAIPTTTPTSTSGLSLSPTAVSTPTHLPGPTGAKASEEALNLATPIPQAPSAPSPTLAQIPVKEVSPVSSPSPKPDAISLPGGRMVFATQEDNGTYNLWVGQTDGSDRRLVAANMHQPDVRADGLTVVNGEGTNNEESLFTVRLDGSDLKEVSANANDVNPRWAPDGTRLLYVNEHLGDLVIQDSPQRDARRLVPHFEATPLLGRRPAWLDDGHIVYQGCDVWRGGSLCGLYVADLTGNVQPWRVVDDVHATSPVVDSGRVAYMSRVDSNWDIYVLGSGQSGPTRLADDPSDEGIPAWSPDGQWLAFLSNRGGGWAIWAIRAELDQTPMKLFDLEGSPGPNWTDAQMSWIP